MDALPEIRSSPVSRYFLGTWNFPDRPMSPCLEVPAQGLLRRPPQDFPSGYRLTFLFSRDTFIFFNCRTCPTSTRVLLSLGKFCRVVDLFISTLSGNSE